MRCGRMPRQHARGAEEKDEQAHRGGEARCHAAARRREAARGEAAGRAAARYSVGRRSLARKRALWRSRTRVLIPDLHGAQSASAEAIAAGLCAHGLSVADHYADAVLVRDLAACAQLRWERGEFAPARVGAAGEARRREEIRGDCICWLAEPLLPAETALLRALEQLRLALNRQATLGLFDLEMHYARYQAGAGYARHVDQPQGRDQRRVSAVLYLNSDWDAALGGSLRVFDGARALRDIAPVAGRLVCFLSAGLEHEVLPSLRTRWSLTGWFRTRA